MIGDLSAALGPFLVLLAGAMLDYDGLGGALLLGGALIALIMGMVAGGSRSRE